jgi:nucleoside-diphosphate-sugar epimerase
MAERNGMPAMKILITGASGFIGGFLVEEALARGHRVVAGIRATSPTEHLRKVGVPLAVMDFSDPDLLQRNVGEQLREHGRFDIVIHNAGITRARQPADFFRVNDTQTRNFAAAFIRAGAIPGKFVYISSLAAHGPSPPHGRAVESGTASPVTAYGKSKLAAELHLAARKEFPALILRPAAVYGPRDKDFLQVYRIIRRGIVPYLGSRSQQLSMIHVEDLARAVLDAAEKAAAGATYFISDGQDYTIRDFNEAVQAAEQAGGQRGVAEGRAVAAGLRHGAIGGDDRKDGRL